MGYRLFFVLLLLKLILADTAKGASKALGQIFKLRACSDTVIGIAHGLVIDPAANTACIFCHLLFLLLFLAESQWLELQEIRKPLRLDNQHSSAAKARSCAVLSSLSAETIFTPASV